MKCLQNKRGITIEITALFMLLAVGLSTVILTFAMSMSVSTSSYRSVIESKFEADKIAAAFQSGLYTSDQSFDADRYERDYDCEGQYSFSYRAEQDGTESLDVYKYSELVECVESFLADPYDCLFNFDFSSIKGWFAKVVMDFWGTQSSGLVPTLEIYSGTVCKLKIYTERVYDEDGLPVTVANHYLYQPTAVTWQNAERVETVDENGDAVSSLVYEWVAPVPFTNDAVRDFYETCADGVVFLKIAKNSEDETVFLKYRYGLT